MTGKARRKTPRKRTTPRRRPSTEATLGSAIGALIGGALFALIDNMPWWLWVILVLVGLVVGYLVHRFRSARTAPPAPR
jgi:uncharacterized membrane protein YfcA